MMGLLCRVLGGHDDIYHVQYNGARHEQRWRSCRRCGRNVVMGFGSTPLYPPVPPAPQPPPPKPIAPAIRKIRREKARH